jgi:hypothetical protein
MATFVIGAVIETNVPTIEVTVDPNNPLPVGKHSFQLTVTDDAGNSSAPDTVVVIVRDSINPTAVVSAPSQVEFGATFQLDGRRSSDVAPGKVVKYVWTMLD